MQEFQGIWTASDTQLMVAWVKRYIIFLETEPVALYGRMMANYVGANFDEQLLACYIFTAKCALSFCVLRVYVLCNW